MPRNRLVLSLLTTFIVAHVSGCGPKEAKETRLTRVLVTGEADLKAQPDTAVLVISVITQNQRAVSAQQENARKTEAVIQAVKETAGGTPEIQTSDYSLQPQESYRYNRLPSIIGYEARNSVTVRTGELDNVGAVIDAASRAGANSVENVRFILRENNPARRQTLAEATRQALGKAESMAEALGGRVVRVVEEQEGGVAYRPPITEERQEYNAARTSTLNAESAARISPRTPFEAGSLQIKSQVQLIVEIEAQPQAAKQ